MTMEQRAEPVRREGDASSSGAASEVPVEEFSRDLDAKDRCDVCQAQALTRVLLRNGELMFCGHHFSFHEDKLTVAAIAITDQRDRIEELV